MEIRVIKSQSDYETVLAEAERLVALDPPADSEDAHRLELWAILIEDYERKRCPLGPPDPIKAIEFRMEEQQLRQKDLVPLLGSRSRVSEVLSGKRPLTVQMIRSLSTGLGIPLEALVAPPSEQSSSSQGEEFEWKRFPYREMEKRGWFAPLAQKGFSSSEELIKAFFSEVREPQALYRRTIRGQGHTEETHYSVVAWTARVLIQAKNRKIETSFDLNRINAAWLRNLVSLSLLEKGPALAIEYLEKSGIMTVIEPQLPSTLIDGASLLTASGTPVIGLTLRYDRVDNFWFTLMHEIAHIWKHIKSNNEMFVDRFEKSDSDDVMEKEANRIARDALVPRAVWRRSPAFLAPSRETILKLADELHIHPAIIVGRLHSETGNYTTFRDLVGQGTVRKLFLH